MKKSIFNTVGASLCHFCFENSRPVGKNYFNFILAILTIKVIFTTLKVFAFLMQFSKTFYFDLELKTYEKAQNQNTTFFRLIYRFIVGFPNPGNLIFMIVMMDLDPIPGFSTYY